MEEDEKGYNIFLKQPTDLIDWERVVRFWGITNPQKPRRCVCVTLTEDYRGYAGGEGMVPFLRWSVRNSREQGTHRIPEPVGILP
jgi:hypothetical protein